jgi:hypothetical protein
MLERHQELELLFGQMIGGEHKNYSLLLKGEHKQSVFGLSRSMQMGGQTQGCASYIYS